MVSGRSTRHRSADATSEVCIVFLSAKGIIVVSEEDKFDKPYSQHPEGSPY